MSAILIEKNEQKIKEVTEGVENLLPDLQKLYTEFLNIGIIFTYPQFKQILITTKIKQISNARDWLGNEQLSTLQLDSSSIEDVIAGLLVDKIENPVVAGIPISKEKLKGLIELPDLSDIKDALFNVANKFRLHDIEIKRYIEYFQVKDETIQPVDNYQSKIEKEWSYYAKTAKQIKLTQELEKLRDSLNAYFVFMKTNGYLSDRPEMPEIRGLELNQYRMYKISYPYITNINPLPKRTLLEGAFLAFKQPINMYHYDRTKQDRVDS